MKLLCITQYDERGASSRCRVYQYLPHLATRGIQAEVLSRFPSLTELGRRAAGVDAVLIQKRVPSLLQLLLLCRRGSRLLFDFDDAIWLRSASAGKPVRPARWQKRLRLAAALRLADQIIAGNDYLATYARRWTSRVTILPTPVDLDYYGAAGIRPSAVRSDSSLPLLGWVGHPSTLGYLRRLEPVLGALARRYPGLRLRVVCSEPYESAAIPVENITWSLEEEVANLRGFDIGLMPLEDDLWARGKCAYKALQYMAVGTPVVCSPVGMNRDVIQKDENGLLAGDLTGWEKQVARLIESPELRQRLGAAGRQTVEERYSLAALAPRLAALLEGVRE
jgi:glycosyltransferase involved in cell wall biosynthesis